MTPEHSRGINSESQPEVLRLKDFRGVYGRLLLASQSPTEIDRYINPASHVDIPTAIDLQAERDYSLGAKSSRSEREAAWQTWSFDKAYGKWREDFTGATNGIEAADETRLNAFTVVTGKQAKDFTAEDTDKLYDTFCRGKSDIDKFVKTVVTNIAGGGLGTQDLSPLISNIEWVSRKLFGQHSAEAISRMIELEIKIKTQPEKVVPALFSYEKRLNENLTRPEKEMLSFLYNGLGAQEAAPVKPVKKREIKTTPPSAPEIQPLEEEQVEPIILESPEAQAIKTAYLAAEDELKAIQDEQTALVDGEMPIDPTTNQPFIDKTAAWKYLRQKYDDAMIRYAVTRESLLNPKPIQPLAEEVQPAPVNTPSYQEPIPTEGEQIAMSDLSEEFKKGLERKARFGHIAPKKT